MGLTRRAFVAAAGTATGTAVVGSAAAQGSRTVRMITEGGDYYFDPVGLFVEPGTTVVFENVKGSHNSVAYPDRIPEGATEWSTPVGRTAEHTFEKPGTYDYYCQPHRTLGMVGRIVVGEPGGPAVGSMPPDGTVPDSKTIVEEGSVSHAAFTGGGPGGGGDTTRTRLVGAGLLGGMALLATVVYWLGNSEGERYRVGSSEWRRRNGLE